MTLPDASPQPGRLAIWQRRFTWFGWILVLTSSVLVALLPDTISTSNEALFLLIVLFSFLLLCLITIGVIFLQIGYLNFFRRAWGMWLLLALSFVGAYFAANPLADAPLLIRRLITVAAMWGIVTILALAPAIVIYVFLQDRAARLFALTFLIFIWVAAAMAQAIGPGRMLEYIANGTLSSRLAWLGNLLCFVQWVILLAPLAFLAHTLRLLYDEWLGVGPLEVTDKLPET